MEKTSKAWEKLIEQHPSTAHPLAVVHIQLSEAHKKIHTFSPWVSEFKVLNSEFVIVYKHRHHYCSLLMLAFKLSIHISMFLLLS